MIRIATEDLELHTSPLSKEKAEEIVEVVFADYVKGRGCALDWNAESYVERELWRFLKQAGKTWVECAREFGLSDKEIVEAILKGFIVE